LGADEVGRHWNISCWGREEIAFRKVPYPEGNGLKGQLSKGWAVTSTVWGCQSAARPDVGLRGSRASGRNPPPLGVTWIIRRKYGFKPASQGHHGVSAGLRTWRAAVPWRRPLARGSRRKHLGGRLDRVQIDAVLHRKGWYAVPRKGWRYWERCRWPIRGSRRANSSRRLDSHAPRDVLGRNWGSLQAWESGTLKVGLELD
jgi:hypothetical protein